jgi:hypothetical protein
MLGQKHCLRGRAGRIVRSGLRVKAQRGSQKGLGCVTESEILSCTYFVNLAGPSRDTDRIEHPAVQSDDLDACNTNLSLANQMQTNTRSKCSDFYKAAIAPATATAAAANDPMPATSRAAIAALSVLLASVADAEPEASVADAGVPVWDVTMVVVQSQSLL